MSTVTPAAIEKTWLALLPLMVSLSAPRPVIDRSSLTVSSAPPSTIGWSISDASNVIVSAPGVSLACSTAQRSEPSRCPHIGHQE